MLALAAHLAVASAIELSAGTVKAQCAEEVFTKYYFEGFLLLGRGLVQEPDSIRPPPQVYIPYGFWQQEGRHRESVLSFHNCIIQMTFFKTKG